jgi:hypothetical protein
MSKKRKRITSEEQIFVTKNKDAIEKIVCRNDM